MSTLQAGQEAITSTRAARVVGYGADLTLTATESLVEKVLPDIDSEESDDEEIVKEGDEETPPTNEGWSSIECVSESLMQWCISDDAPVVVKKSFFGLRKRKSHKEESNGNEVTLDNEDRDQEGIVHLCTCTQVGVYLH